MIKWQKFLTNTANYAARCIVSYTGRVQRISHENLTSLLLVPEVYIHVSAFAQSSSANFSQ